MNKTDGKLLKLIEGMSYQQLSKLCLFAVLLWSASPIIIAILNLLNVNSYTYYGVISMVLYFSGGFGLMFGSVAIYKKIVGSGLNRKDLINRIQPLIILFLLFVWSIICTLFADEKRVAIYGYEMLRNNLITFLFYGGLVFAGIGLSLDEKNVVLCAKAFSIVATVVSVLQVLGEETANAFFKSNVIENDITTFLYNSQLLQSEYLIVSLLIIIALFAFSDSRVRFLYLPMILIVFAANLECINIVQLVILALLLFLALIYAHRNSQKNMMKNILVSIASLLVLLISYILLEWYSIPTLIDDFRNDLANNLVAWERAIAFISDVPIVGVGPQNSMLNANNLFLQIAVYLGFTGTVLFLSIIIIIFIQCRYENMGHYLLTIIAVLVMMLIEYAFYGTEFYILAFMFIFLGLSIGFTTNLNDE